MSDWRQNRNLIECYENCVAMFRKFGSGEEYALPSRPKARVSTTGAEIRNRRVALGLSQTDLDIASGVHVGCVGLTERGDYKHGVNRERIFATLDRLESEARQVAE